MSLTMNEMRDLLEFEGIRLTKSLGQNFLHDRNQLSKIVAAGDVKPGDAVLEIGPGLGPLTEALLDAGARVRAIEKDTRLAALLRRRLAGRESLELVEADALDRVEDQSYDWSGWKLVANLPFSVASPILVELALNPCPPARIAVTLQLEVARRLAAGPGSDDYGLLSLLVQQAFEPRGLFKIPPGCFFPQPEVDSACITLVRRASPLLTPEQRAIFVRLTKLGLGQRRKQSLKLLKAGWPEELLREAFERVGLSAQARAETFSLSQFVALSKTVESLSHG